VAKGTLDDAIVDKECAGHLKAVALERADKMAIDDAGAKAAKEDTWSKELGERATGEVEGAVEGSIRVADAWEVGDAKVCEGGLTLGVGAHVDEENADALGFDGRAFGCDIGESFAAECAAGVAKEDDQERRLAREVEEGSAEVCGGVLERGG